MRNILPVDDPLARHSSESITRVGATQLDLTEESLPAGSHSLLLEQAR